jgi:hypothetical protein
MIDPFFLFEERRMLRKSGRRQCALRQLTPGVGRGRAAGESAGCSEKLTAASLGLALLCAGAGPTMARNGVSDAALAAAGPKARIGQIDYSHRPDSTCPDERTVAQWLNAVHGTSARSVRWTGGACHLINERNPLDAGSPWCADAEILPRRGKLKATIEIYFEKPVNGRPGEPYAFRSLTLLLKNEMNYGRSPAEFAGDWRATHMPDDKAPDGAADEQDCKP